MLRIVFLLLLTISSMAAHAQSCASDRDYMEQYGASCTGSHPTESCGTPHCQQDPGHCLSGYTFSVYSYASTQVVGRCRAITCEGKFFGIDADGASSPKNKSCFRNLIPTLQPRVESPLQCQGSIIEPTTQTLGEIIPVQGATFDLVYFSNRVVGRLKDYSVDILIQNPPPSVDYYAVNICNPDGTCAIPNNENHSIGTVPVDTNNNTYNFHYEWAGLSDAGIETWAGSRRSINVNENGSGLNADTEIVLGSLKAKKLGLGGWVPSVWHFYSKDENAIYFGDGSRKVVIVTTDNGYTRYASDDAAEVYYFDETGKIVMTKYGLTGEIKYTFAYDSAERLSSISEPFGRVTVFNRSASGLLKNIVAPKNIKTTAIINSDGYLSKSTNPALESYEMTYTTKGLMTSFKKPSSEIANFTYDSVGNLLTDSSNSGRSTTLSSITNGVRKTSALGIFSDITFDPSASMETIATAGSGSINQSTTVSNIFYQDADTFSSKNKDYDPRFPESQYISFMNNNSFGARVTFISKSASTTNSNDPYAFTTLTKTVTAGQTKLTSVYSAATKTFAITSKLGKTRTLTIDNFERPTVDQVGDLVATEYTYNDDLLTRISHGPRKSIFTYYANNLLKSVRNSLNQTTTFTYDDAQRLKTTTLPDLRVISYTYDANGNLKNITPPGRPQHQLNYEVDGELSSYNPPVLSGESVTATNYTYNSDRQVTNITRPDGKEINMNYNTSTGFLDSITGDFTTINRLYDSGGHVSLISQAMASSQINYTGGVPTNYIVKDTTGALLYRFDRSASTSYGGKIGQEKLYAYTNSADQKIINYSYNNDEDLISAGDMSLEYDSLTGQLTKTTLGHFKDYYYYNNLGEIKRYVAKRGPAIIYEYELERDSTGRISKKSETLNNILSIFEYTYDTAGRLTQVIKNGVVDSTYTYDVNGNRTGGTIHGENVTASYDDQDRLVNYNGQAHQYNANGDLVSRGTENFEYDVFGNLKQRTRGTNILSYESEALQRRSSRIVNGQVTTKYVYSPEGKLIGQLDKTGKLIKTFVYASKSYVPDFYIDQNNKKFRIITDQLGSVRLVVANSGRVLEMMEHDEFGRVVQDTRPGFLPFGFAGGIYERVTGLVRFGVRDYDAETGRWLSKDPIRFKGGDTNLYGYVMADPVNWIDPIGLKQLDPAVGAIPAFRNGSITGEFVPASGVTDITPGMFIGAVFAMPAAGAIGAIGSIVSPAVIVGAATLNPATISNGIDFFDSFSGEIGGPTTGLPPSTPGGYGGMFLGREINKCGK